MKSKLKVLITLICALALIATGTFAWEQIITARNEFIGDKTPEEDVTLHDDFDPDTSKKDVYVENTGDVALYVRVKLDEAMSLTNNKWRPGATDWVTHKHGQTPEDCGFESHESNRFHDYFKWTMGGWKYYKSTDGSRSLVQDVNEYTEAQYNDPNTGVKKTPDAQIITSEAFLALSPEQQKAFQGWIYSTDGYAYWSQPLNSGEATGLLLHGVRTMNSIKGTEYYYVIDVILEVVDMDDIPMWTQGAQPNDGGDKHPEASEDGKEVINVIIGNTSGEDGEPGDGEPGDGEPGDGEPGDGEPGDGKPGDELPVNKPDGGFFPITDPDAMIGDGYYAMINYMDPGNHEKNEFYHTGSIHLEDIITDGNYSNVTAEALEAKYKPFISIGTCPRHGGKPSIIFSYEPTSLEWANAFGNNDYDVITPVSLMLARDDGKTAEITINMIYPLCLVTIL